MICIVTGDGGGLSKSEAVGLTFCMTVLGAIVIAAIVFLLLQRRTVSCVIYSSKKISRKRAAMDAWGVWSRGGVPGARGVPGPKEGVCYREGGLIPRGGLLSQHALRQTTPCEQND